MKSNPVLSKFFTKKSIYGEVSINDLREKEFSGHRLSELELQSVRNYDNYRIRILNHQMHEKEFHQAYRQLQVIANLGDWTEFLKEEYNYSGN